MFDKLKPWEKAPFSYDVELFAATDLPQGCFELSVKNPVATELLLYVNLIIFLCSKLSAFQPLYEVLTFAIKAFHRFVSLKEEILQF